MAHRGIHIWVRRVIALIVAVAAIGLSAGCEVLKPQRPQEEQAEQRWKSVRAGMKLQLAKQQADRGLFKEALAGATEAIALDPKLADAFVLAVKAHLELGQLASAEQMIAAASQQGLSSPELLYLSGVICEQRGQTDAALEKYREARSAAGVNVDYIVAEAESLVALNRADEALSLLESNSHSFDDDATVALLAGRIASMVGKTEAALKWYREAAARLPGNAWISRELGLLLAQTDHCGEAIAQLRGTGASNAETSGVVCRALATCYLKTDDAGAAVAVLRNCLADRSTDHAGQLLLAQAALATDDLLTAARALFLAEKHGAPAGRARFLRAAIQFQQGKTKEAATVLEAALQADPSDAEVSGLLGEVYLAMDRPQDAAEAFSRALHLSPESAWAAAGLAKADHRVISSANQHAEK